MIEEHGNYDENDDGHDIHDSYDDDDTEASAPLQYIDV